LRSFALRSFTNYVQTCGVHPERQTAESLPSSL